LLTLTFLQIMEKLNLLLKKFWETETGGIENVQVFEASESAALSMAEKSIAYNGECYRIAIPRKDNFTNLPNNTDMAE